VLNAVRPSGAPDFIEIANENVKLGHLRQKWSIYVKLRPKWSAPDSTRRQRKWL